MLIEEVAVHDESRSSELPRLPQDVKHSQRTSTMYHLLLAPLRGIIIASYNDVKYSHLCLRVINHLTRSDRTPTHLYGPLFSPAWVLRETGDMRQASR